MDDERVVEICDRAVRRVDSVSLGSGDKAVASVVAFRSAAISGGIEHALDALTPAQLAAAADGFVYLDAPLLESVVDRSKIEASAKDLDALASLNDEYDLFVPQDETLIALVSAAVARNPDGFSPLT